MESKIELDDQNDNKLPSGPLQGSMGIDTKSVSIVNGLNDTIQEESRPKKLNLFSTVYHRLLVVFGYFLHDSIKINIQF